jgi:hypothetical protein
MTVRAGQDNPGLGAPPRCCASWRRKEKLTRRDPAGPSSSAYCDAFGATISYVGYGTQHADRRSSIHLEHVAFSLCIAKREWDADYCFDFCGFRCRSFSSFGCSVNCMGDDVSDERSQNAETLFEQTRWETRDAIKLEEERRAALVKNLYRLRALRLSRERGEFKLATDSCI